MTIIPGILYLNLSSSGISVSLIERNYDRCMQLAASLPDITVVHGDATDQNLLESQGLSDSDALVTMTGLDAVKTLTLTPAVSCAGVTIASGTALEAK